MGGSGDENHSHGGHSWRITIQVTCEYRETRRRTLVAAWQTSFGLKLFNVNVARSQEWKSVLRWNTFQQQFHVLSPHLPDLPHYGISIAHRPLLLKLSCFFVFFLRLSTYRYGFLLRHIAAKSLTCLSTRWRGISQTSVGSFWWTNKFSKLALKETYNTRWEEFIFRSFDFKKWIGLKCLSRLFFTILSLHLPPSVFQNERKNRKFSFPAINSSPQ